MGWWKETAGEGVSAERGTAAQAPARWQVGWWLRFAVGLDRLPAPPGSPSGMLALWGRSPGAAALARTPANDTPPRSPET